MDRIITSYMNKSIGFSLIVLLVLQIIFPGKLYSIEWLVAALAAIVFAFHNIQALTIKWSNYSERSFINHLFWLSLTIRIVIMFILLIISYKTWGMFYYVGAMDEMKYFRIASEAAEIYDSTGLSQAYAHILDTYSDDISDTGFCTFQTLFFIIFGYAPVLMKIVNCILGSITVVRLYQLTGLITEKPIAKLSALLFMLYPISWFFSAVLMKEAMMVLLIVESMYQIVKLQNVFKVHTLVKLLALIILLFFFRSTISILLILVAAISLLMQTKKKRLLINIFLTTALIAGYFYFLTRTGNYEKYYEQYADTEDFVNQRILTGSQVNPYTALASAPLYLSISLFAPFPSIVKVPISFGREIPHDEYYYHVAGNLYWVILSFFSLIGLYYAIRYHRRDFAPIWIFIIGYQFILLRAILFTSVRFTFPLKPFLLIMAAFGIYKLIRRKWFSLYLIAALVMILGWNYVRLMGRGGG